jgi:putative NADH-flavin reductase
MNNKPTIAVLGGGGRTGKFVIARLLEQQYPLKVLLRDRKNFVTHHLVTNIHGDAIDPASISNLLCNCHAVISTIGQRKGEPLVAACSTTNILGAMQIHGLHRYIAIAGLNVDTPSDQKGSQTVAATTWMKTNYPEIQQDRQNAYSILSGSEISWTLARVPMIEFTDGTGNYKVSTKDCPGTSICAGDIAQFLVQQLQDVQYLKAAPFIAN